MSYPDSILAGVQKPARYTGGEWHSVDKEWQETDIHLVLSYPDVYEVGMSGITLPILYQAINGLSFALADRVFAPWPDMEQALRQNRLALQGIETGKTLAEFDVIGFLLGYELNCTNLLNILDLGGIPVNAIDRDESHPLVMGGGIGAMNPEPLADFVDFFVIGDGEEIITQITELVRALKQAKASRRGMLEELSHLGGVYVPSFYDVEYDINGRFKSIEKKLESAAMPVERIICRELPLFPEKPIVPLIETAQDKGSVEISRGCTRGCRFCNAGIYYRPLRHRSQEEICSAVQKLISSCGYDEITLLSLSSGDYPDITGLINRLSRTEQSRGITFSLPSLRIDEKTLELVEALSQRRRSGITLAPEAATSRLQRVINKVIPEEDILQTAATAFERGWTSLKLYFMLGLPTETEEDVVEIARLASRIFDLGYRSPGRRPKLRLSLSTFVPKAHTPFQWFGQINSEEILKRVNLVRDNIGRRKISISWHDPQTSLLEAVMSRGDRRLGRVIYRAWQLGARFDGWDELFDYNRWREAFEEAGLDPAEYANRQKGIGEPLPWEHISSGVSLKFLVEEYHRAMRGDITPDCRINACNLCGIEKRVSNCHRPFKGAETA
ncbi:MAG: TIGR03960 family B12-binding radical SAM protein [Dehalococcoidales bacterium]|nr:TIGR03960 family B12-binding radical SAM protein [Dehalococcoidales bacterium]MDD4465079.1 TIGR03960 family B12-binding radical SAM protein [Dehalococcoidales bacterium]